MRLSIRFHGLLVCTSSLLLPGCAIAQWGGEADATFGKASTLGQSSSNTISSVGLHAAISYQPLLGNIYPSVAFTQNRLRPDLQNVQYFVSPYCVHRNFMLQLNYKTTGERNYFLLYGGIGVSYIRPNPDLGTDPLSGSPLRLVDSGNVRWYPAVNAGVQFMHQLGRKLPIYASVSGSLTYIRMWIDANEYYIRSSTALVKTNMNYNILFPNVMAGICYFIRRKE